MLRPRLFFTLESTPLHLDVVEEVLRLVVESDRAAGHDPGTLVLNRARRDRFTPRTAMAMGSAGRTAPATTGDHRALPGDWRRSRAKRFAIDIYVVSSPTGNVIPEHHQVVIGRVAANTPCEERFQHPGIAHVGLAQALDRILRQVVPCAGNNAWSSSGLPRDRIAPAGSRCRPTRLASARQVHGAGGVRGCCPGEYSIRVTASGREPSS
jgi:hypothetical protein